VRCGPVCWLAGLAKHHLYACWALPSTTLHPAPGAVILCLGPDHLSLITFWLALTQITHYL